MAAAAPIPRVGWSTFSGACWTRSFPSMKCSFADISDASLNRAAWTMKVTRRARPGTRRAALARAASARLDRPFCALARQPARLSPLIRRLAGGAGLAAAGRNPLGRGDHRHDCVERRALAEHSRPTPRSSSPARAPASSAGPGAGRARRTALRARRQQAAEALVALHELRRGTRRPAPTARRAGRVARGWRREADGTRTRA